MIVLGQKDKKFLLYIGVLVGLYILPIMLADFYYADDLYRSLNGVSGFDNDGRILSYIYFLVFSFGKYILDFSPLNLIFSGVALILSSFLVYKRFFENISSPIIASFLGFLFISSPFFLTNLSYKYDCITMSLSVLLSTYAFFILSENRILRINLILSVVFLSSALLFYQNALPSFISLTMLWVGLNISEHTKKYIFLSILICVVSYGLYFMISYPFLTGWVKEQSKLIIPNLNGLKTFNANLHRVTYRIMLLLKDHSFYTLFVFPLIFSWCYLIYINRNRALSCVFSICLPVFLYFSCILPCIILIHSTGALRLLIGFMTIMLFSWVGLISFLERTKYKKLQYLIIFPVLYCLSFSYIYANASKSQKNFDTQITTNIINNLLNLNLSQSINRLLIIGEKPIPPERKLLEQKRPILAYLVFDRFEKGNWVAPAWFHHFAFNNIKEVLFEGLNTEADLLTKESHSFPVIRENNLYTLKVMNDTAVITYKNKDS